MRNLLVLLVVASVALLGAPSASGQSVEEDTSQCPNHTLEVPNGSLHPTALWVGPVSIPCQATLEGATSVRASTTTYFGLTDGENFVGDAQMTVVDVATGETLGECSASGSTPIDGYIPGLSSIASCNVALRFEEPTDLTVECRPSGTLAGNFGCHVS